MRLSELHRYEAARRAPLAEEVYRANAALLMPDDANCYRFELLRHEAAAEETAGGFSRVSVPPPAAAAAADADANAVAVKQEQPPPPTAAAAGAGSGTEAVALSVQLMDPDRVEVHPAGLDSVFGEYMRAFMASSAGSDAKEGRVFLQRHARAAGVVGPAGETDEAALQRLRGGIALSNGLECKISCSNSKVSYVLDTEDVAWRRGPRKAAQRAAAAAAAGEKPPACPDAGKEARYRAWLAKREEALRPGFQPYVGSFPESMAIE